MKKFLFYSHMSSGNVIWKAMVLTALFTFHFSLFTSVSAQKFALIDMEYILKKPSSTWSTS